jgi:3-phenylpropionate/cinnamic acid dioxygenase small subunit
MTTIICVITGRTFENGEAISTAPKANTVRSVSRIRVVKDEDGEIILRCAQNLREFRKES